MNDETADARFRQRLFDLRETLQHSLSEAGESAAVVELDQTRVGRLSRMDAMQAQAIAKAAVARDRAMLQKIASALQRIEDGEYGVCQQCDEAISAQRLEVDPTASLCVACAEQLEQRS